MVNCWRTPVATLYRCNGDGSEIRPISTNIEHDNTPWVLPDGRVLYMRWEYVDRAACPIQSLWALNPDGTGLTGVYGNRVFSPGTFMDAQPVPDSGLIMATATSGSEQIVEVRP